MKANQGNTLDWYYVAKLVRKLNREKALAVDQQISDRLAITKERYRVMVERLWKIIDWKLEYINEGIGMPKNDEIRAVNTIVKLDLAILKAEMDNMALGEFFFWYTLEPRPGFTKATVSAWHVTLEERGLGSFSIIVRMSAIRKLAGKRWTTACWRRSWPPASSE